MTFYQYHKAIERNGRERLIQWTGSFDTLQRANDWYIKHGKPFWEIKKGYKLKLVEINTKIRFKP